jgi:hypothetical protein
MIKIFIVGCPRSGTTLVQKLLGARSDIYTCKETHYFQNIRRKGGKKILDYLILSQDNVLKAYDLICSQDELLGSHDPAGAKSLRSAALFFDQLMTSEAQARGKLAWVEKTPPHLFHIRLIRRHIPTAQFVHVIRDGRDVVASLVDAAQKFPQARAWKECADWETATGIYNRCLKESLKYCDGESHVFVQYEHILDDFEGACYRLYTSLGLESENTRLDLGVVHRRVVRRDEGWKTGGEGEIMDTRLVKFNRLFDERQKGLIIGNMMRLPAKLEEKVI